MKTLGNNLNVNQQQLQNLVIHKVADHLTLPSPVSGQAAFNTTNGKGYLYDGTAWGEIINTAASSSYAIISDGTTTATAGNSGDTIRFRSASNLLTVAVGSNDATFGDNILFTINQANISHSALANLTSDDHTQYALLAGRNLGQTLRGGVNASETLTLFSTAHATKGKILFGTSAYDEANNRLGIGTASPTTAIEVASGGVVTAPRYVSNIATGTAPLTVTSTTLVSNLNVDFLRGYAPAVTSSAASLVVVTGSGGKIDLTFLTEVIALSNLSDVSGVTGTGSTVVMSTSPTIATPTLTTPTIADFTNANHSHTSAATGGTLTSAAISNFNAAVQTNRLDQMAAPTAAVSFNNQRITNVATPTAGTDAANKDYVDGVATGLDVKASVRVATTGNWSITTPGTTIDGVTLAVGNRILYKNQTVASENGIYVYTGSGTAATRATDADTGTELTPGTFVFVEEGTVNADSGWVMSADGTITVGTSPITWVQFSGAGQVIAGNGLSKTGNTLSVLGTTNRITVSGAGVDIASNYVGQNTITTLGTITTGVWNATDIAVADGGTGASTAAGARTNLSDSGNPLPQKFTQTIGDGAAQSFTITHNFGTRDVTVQVYEVAAPYDEWEVEVRRASTVAVTVAFGTGIVPTAGQFRVVVTG